MNILKTIETHKELNDVVTVFSNNSDSQRCAAGKIVSCDGPILVLESITPSGYPDGILAFPIERVYKIEANGNYEKKLQYLFERRNSDSFVSKFSINPKPDYYSILIEAQRLNLVVSFWFERSNDDDYVSGLLLSINDGIVNLNVLDDFGRQNGSSDFELETIRGIQIGGENEINLALLYEMNAQAN